VMLLYATDKCLVPLRPALIDVYRTVMMLRKLPLMARMREEEVYSRVGLVFNMVKTGTIHYRQMPKYAEELLNVSPHLHVFDAYIPHRVSFSRVGTEEERPEDRATVEKAFSQFFQEFKRWVGV